ncbi:MAG: hypothetical protein K2J73_07645 [Oscillospiraceae bacterium]|nr:hypothetical protein [Oscillospiraceae bacterium]
MRSRLKNLLIGTLSVLYMVLLIVFVRDIGEAVSNSLKVCFEVIIPSLYAFMIASGFVVSSNLYIVLSKPFGFVSRYIFRIPPEYFSVFLIGSIGGYPVGAKLMSELYGEGKIDKDTAEQMLSYCYLAGPAFICSIAGVRLFSSVKVGMIIFAAIISANLLMAVISGFGRPIPKKRVITAKLGLSSENLIRSVSNGAKGMFSICAVIVFFSTIICILEKSGVLTFISRSLADVTGMKYSDASAAVRSIIEISNISSLSHGNYRLIPLTASLLSFGGLCVLMQVNGFLQGKLSAKRFYFFRILATIISYLLCKLYVEVFDPNFVPTIAPAGAAVRQNSPIPTLFLLIMTNLLLSNISIEKKKKV